MTIESENLERNQNPASQQNGSRRKSSEQTIQDLFVVIGCLMMFMCFGLLLETSLRQWSETQAMEMLIVSSVALSLFAIFFVIYFYSRFRKPCSRIFLGQSSNIDPEVSKAYQRRFN